MSFREKTVIVTGAASGIGRASALRFAREGARVAVADIDHEGGLETVDLVLHAGGDAFHQNCDVSQSNQVQDLVRQTCDRFGPPDVLLNNAAHMDEGARGSVTETTEAGWDRSLAVTLTGAYLCSKYVIPHMVEAGGGAIVSIASVGGLVAFDGMAAYCAAKGGIVMLTKSIARDYGRLGIRANAVAPGAVSTPAVEVDKRRNPDGWASVLRQMSLLDRLICEPEEIAAAVVYLAGDDAAFVTGTVLTVDGGWTAH